MGEDKGCIFCKIIAGEIPSSKIYEDDFSFAFLDIWPVNKGHVLVIPKKHCINLMDIPDDDLGELMIAAKKVAIAVKEGTGCDGISLNMSNEKAAGQEVFHAHVHIMPRFASDGLKQWPHKTYEPGEMEKFSEEIRNKLK